MNEVKKLFPIFENNPDLVYLDSAATSLKPHMVIASLEGYYQDYSANIHRGIYEISEKASEKYEQARQDIAEFIGSKTENTIFTSGTTSAINMVANSFFDLLSENDEILVPISEHHANLLPWQRLANHTGAKLNVLDLEVFDSDLLAEQINANTKVVAFAHASNVLGNIRDIKKISRKIRSLNENVYILVDGAQSTPHLKINLSDTEVDFFVFSGHKVYGPTGVGVLAVSDKSLEVLKPLIVGGGAIESVTKSSYSLLDSPTGFEAGTPPIAQAIGLGEAVKFLAHTIDQSDLSGLLWSNLNEINFVKVIGKPENRIPLVSFTVEGIHAHDVAQFLAERNICVRAGHHCTMPLHEQLGVAATVRASLGAYSTKEDIEKLVDSIKDSYKVLKNG